MVYVRKMSIMFKSIKNIIGEFYAMPLLLKFLTFQAAICFLLFIAAVVPIIPFNVDGKDLTYVELWVSGIGIFTVYVGIAMPISAWLMLSRKEHSRIIYLVILSSVLIVPYVYWKDIGGLAFGVIIIILISIYIYFSPSCKAYFASGKNSGKNWKPGSEPELSPQN